MHLKDLRRFAVQNWFKLAALAMAGAGALYFTLGPMHEAGVAEERAGIRVAWEPQALWHHQSLQPFIGGVVEKLAGSNADAVNLSSLQTGGLSAAVPRDAAQIAEERRMVRTDSLDLVVQNPADALDKIRRVAEGAGGFLETSQVNGEGDATSATLTIRVPSAKFEEVRAEIHKLGLRVESEKVDAQDVTKQYVDQESRLRNLRAEETQYLGILKRASTVSDTLEVSEKLNEVRGQIEQQQAEFEALSKQVETVAFTVSLRAETDTQVFGLHWRPLYQLKLALRNGLDGLGDYLATMTSLAFYLPTILLWLATILVGAALGWRILRWAARVFFGFPRPAIGEKGGK